MILTIGKYVFYNVSKFFNSIYPNFESIELRKEMFFIITIFRFFFVFCLATLLSQENIRIKWLLKLITCLKP